MKLPRPHSLKEIAALVDAPFIGPEDLMVHGINEVHVVEPGDIAFVDHPKYYDKTLASAATVVIINKEVDCPEGKGLIVHDDPFDAFNELTKRFRPFQSAETRIAPDAVIGEGTVIQPTAFVGNGVKIGKDCLIQSGVSIGDNIEIGDRVIIHANTALGGDAFYYKKRDSGYDKLHSCGRVVIHDDVEIGTGCTIDRGVTGDTVIGEGTKIDNMVHIGHDTRVGKKCLFAAQVGIAGCVTIEDEVTLWGQVGCIANVTLGKGATVLAQSGIGNSLEPGKVYFGSPAGEARKKMRELATLSRLSE